MQRVRKEVNAASPGSEEKKTSTGISAQRILREKGRKEKIAQCFADIV